MNQSENMENEELRQSLSETRLLNQQRVRERKRKRRLQYLKTTLLVLAITGLLVAAGLVAWKFFAEQRFLSPSRSDMPPKILSAEESRPEQLPEPALPEEPEDVGESEPAPTGQEEPLPAAEEPVELEAVTAPEPEAPPAAEEPFTAETRELDLELYSEHAILIDWETGIVLAEKDPDARIYPASMTKVMTALVACEQIADWDETFTMTQDIIDPLFLADATLAGFVNGEEVTMTDLVYGAILPSGAEATEALAIVVAGSEEAYAELMNEKAAELGCEDTHFADASGLHNEEHYTTVRDMAKILRAAMENERCREALSAVRYTSRPTPQNPEGVEMINKFLYRVSAREVPDIQIAAAKTGYTAQAMNCCASFGAGANGRPVLCVTAHAWTGDFCIEDHITLYSQYAK